MTREPKQETKVAVRLTALRPDLGLITAHNAKALCRISRSLSRMSEYECSYEMTDADVARAEKREKRLLIEATEIAKAYGLAVYHQGDPRGAAIYLVRPDLNLERHSYTDGIACY